MSVEEPKPARETPPPTSDDVFAAIFSLLAAVDSLEAWAQDVNHAGEEPLFLNDEREVA